MSCDYGPSNLAVFPVPCGASVSAAQTCRPDACGKLGYTLVEVLIATTLALMLMAAVARMFGQLGASVNNSRATLETADRLRAAALRHANGPRRPDRHHASAPPRRERRGLLRVCRRQLRGRDADQPVNDHLRAYQARTTAASAVSGAAVAGTVGEQGDILMFTTRNSNRPFNGLLNGNTIQSETAEVAWFLRGHNLHRRVLLVAPGVTLSGADPGSTFFSNNDISVHLDTQSGQLVPNTLADLTRRECRFAHAVYGADAGTYPYDVRGWGQLGLPTSCECAAMSWAQCSTPTGPSSPLKTVDLWSPIARTAANTFWLKTTRWRAAAPPTASPTT